VWGRQARERVSAAFVVLTCFVTVAFAALPEPASAEPLYKLTADIPVGWVPPTCGAVATTARCENAIISYLDAARSKLGLGPYELPSDFTALPPDRQIFILSNLDRLAYGLAPVPGLVPGLNVLAEVGVIHETDPNVLPPYPGMPIHGGSANWAGGWRNALEGYYAWMYFDSCCAWGHRADVLWSLPKSDLAMGAAAGVSGKGHRGYAMVMEGFVIGQPLPFAYTWAEAAADGAGTYPYNPGPVPHPVVLTVQVQGDGAGLVSGLASCWGFCHTTLDTEISGTLTATARAGSLFTGWGGACGGLGTCTLSTYANAAVTARFVLKASPPRYLAVRIGIGGRVAAQFWAYRARGYQCAIVQQRSRTTPRPRFVGCRSPVIFRALRKGRYYLYVRSTGELGDHSSAQRRAFAIP
jgi:hypothetical protein